jgi:uncharacterized membrane protein
MKAESLLPLRRSLLAMTLLCLGAMILAVLGVAATRQFRHSYLVWNLVLGLIPLALALWIHRLEAGNRMVWSALAAIAWLLFLPNSPYILTDFMHLTHTPRAWFWGHLMALVWFSFTALLAGLLSLRIMHDLVERRFGHGCGWTFAMTTSLLAGLGVTLGRFHRWNSWDAVRQPGDIVLDALRHLPVSNLSLETLFPWAFGAFFGAAYLMVWTLTSHAHAEATGSRSVGVPS